MLKVYKREKIYYGSSIVTIGSIIEAYLSDPERMQTIKNEIQE